MPAWAYALLGWIGGVATTVGGSWLSSKIHVYHEAKKVHLEALRDQVLIPLRSGLEEHLKPFLIQQKPVVVVDLNPNEFKESAKVTEEQTDWAIRIAANCPFGRVFGKIESALLQDAQMRHFVALMASLEELCKEWLDYSGRCPDVGLTNGRRDSRRLRLGPFHSQSDWSIRHERPIGEFCTSASVSVPDRCVEKTRGEWPMDSG